MKRIPSSSQLFLRCIRLFAFFDAKLIDFLMQIDARKSMLQLHIECISCTVYPHAYWCTTSDSASYLSCTHTSPRMLASPVASIGRCTISSHCCIMLLQQQQSFLAFGCAHEDRYSPSHAKNHKQCKHYSSICYQSVSSVHAYQCTVHEVYYILTADTCSSISTQPPYNWS